MFKNIVREVSVLVRFNAATPFGALLRSIKHDKDELIRGSRLNGSIHVTKAGRICHNNPTIVFRFVADLQIRTRILIFMICPDFSLKPGAVTRIKCRHEARGFKIIAGSQILITSVTFHFVLVQPWCTGIPVFTCCLTSSHRTKSVVTAIIHSRYPVEIYATSYTDSQVISFPCFVSLLTCLRENPILPWVGKTINL